jgi:hypothetical protein
MVSKKLRLVVLGMMGEMPFAGLAWQVLHYLEGFRRLGHDVYYVEDTGSEWPYDPEQDTLTDDYRYTVDYINRVMTWCGLPDRWAYRAAAQDGRTYGLSESQLSHLFRRADALVNVGGGTVLRDEHLRVPVRVYLETDPVLPQIAVAQGQQYVIDLLSAHTHHFTYAENLGAPDCSIPLGPFDYHPTRQPIVLDWWAPAELPSNGGRKPSADCRFTTVANWQQSDKDVEWNGEIYTWSKHQEFLKFIDLPRRTEQPLELALASADVETIRLLRAHGWRVVDSLALSKDLLPYRSYVRSSRGEFTVVKPQYFLPRGGSFSDRSACYLAAGRPVVTQDTGFGKILPTGRGLFAFQTMEDIVVAMETIESDYEKHRREAWQIAREYFAAEKVLGSLIEQAGL